MANNDTTDLNQRLRDAIAEAKDKTISDVSDFAFDAARFKRIFTNHLNRALNDPFFAGLTNDYGKSLAVASAAEAVMLAAEAEAAIRNAQGAGML